MIPDHPVPGPAPHRSQLDADPADTELDAAARRLTEAYAEYEDALDRRASLGVLQALDREVARAEQAHVVLARRQRRSG